MILDLAFIFIFFLFPVLLSLLLRAVGMPLFSLHLTTFVILACLVLGYLGLLPLYFGWDDYRLQSGVNNRELIFYVLLGSIWTISSLAFGLIIGVAIYGRRSKVPINISHENRFFKLKTFLLLIIILFTLVNYLERVPEIAIFLAVSGSISDAESARSLMGNNFGAGYHWYSLIMHGFSSFLVYFTFSAWLAKKSISTFIIFWCSFCIAAFTSVMAIEKGPLIWLLIGILMVWLLDRNHGQISFSKILPSLVLGIVLLTLIYMIFEGSADLVDAFLAALSRAFSGSIQPAYYYLEYFPTKHDFLYGRSFPNPSGLLPFEHFSLTVEVMNWIMGGSGDVVRSAPTIFWTELYANFGIFGVLVLPVFIGFILFFIQVLIEILPDGPVKVGYYVWVLLHFKNLAVSPFSLYVVDIYFFGVTLVALLFLCGENKVKPKLKNA